MMSRSRTSAISHRRNEEERGSDYRYVVEGSRDKCLRYSTRNTSESQSHHEYWNEENDLEFTSLRQLADKREARIERLGVRRDCQSSKFGFVVKKKSAPVHSILAMTTSTASSAVVALRLALFPWCILLLLLSCGSFPTFVRAIEGTIGSSKDHSSYSNVDQFLPTHISFDIAVTFEDSSTEGTITHTITVLNSDITTIYLDVWDGLTVKDAEFKAGSDDFESVPFNITTPNPNIGNALAVVLPVEMVNGTEFFLRFTYQTNPFNTGLNWLTPAQTAGKKLPFMYSLCQLNFCRDVAPMMDTPSVKITYDATVLAPSEFVVAMSANQTGSVAVNETHTVTMFNCTIKLPSYLIAIVVGDLAKKTLSDRVSVMSEPSLVDAAAEEFAGLPDILDIVEEYLTPYIWGNYTIVFMPPSFPWGGMEHPLITFATHTLVAGDKSQVDVAVHELTHSWFGNDVGCQNWNNFWLNEGINTFMERKVLASLNGIDFAKVEYFTGNVSLYADILDYGVDNPYSSLFPDIGDANPEDSFSGVPYEKGSQFCYWMESLVGEEVFQAFLRSYIETFAQKAINSENLNTFYEDFVNSNFNATDAATIINMTDFETWVYKPGLPPVTIDFRTAELQTAMRLAQEYASLGGEASPVNYTSFFDYFGSLKVAFVQELAVIDSVDAALLAYIDMDLNLTYTLNPSLKNDWYELGIMKGYDAVIEPAYIWLGQQGRNAYVRPLFRALVAIDNCDTAMEWYGDYESFYNFYVIDGLSRDLAPCSETAAPNAAPAPGPSAAAPSVPTSHASSSRVFMQLPLIAALLAMA